MIEENSANMFVFCLAQFIPGSNTFSLEEQLYQVAQRDGKTIWRNNFRLVWTSASQR